MPQKMKIEFEARTYRVRFFGRRRYAVSLFADGIFTGLTFSALTRQEAREESELLANSGAEVLEYHGLAQTVFEELKGIRAYQHTGVYVGDWVRLKEAAGGLAAGHICKVTRIDLNEDCTAADEFPVIVRPTPVTDETKGIVLPLQLHEFEFVGSPA